MKKKQLQTFSFLLVIAAVGIAFHRFSTVARDGGVATDAAEKAGKRPRATLGDNLSNVLNPSEAQKKFETHFTVEFLSVEHDRTPTEEEWQELTRILFQAEGGELVDEVKARFSVHAGSKELATLVAAYENPVNHDTRQRIMDIFSTLHSTDFKGTARRILNDETRPITDHLVCASAISLVRMGEEQDILAVFRRLNAAGEDPIPGGSLYPETDGLIGAMIEARNPALVMLLMDAAAGRGVATTGQARMAAAAALANYSTVPVTEVLYDLSKNETNEQVRKQAERSLRAIQTNE